jgi:hypothetical protein
VGARPSATWFSPPGQRAQPEERAIEPCRCTLAYEMIRCLATAKTLSPSTCSPSTAIQASKCITLAIHEFPLLTGPTVRTKVLIVSALKPDAGRSVGKHAQACSRGTAHMRPSNQVDNGCGCTSKHSTGFRINPKRRYESRLAAFQPLRCHWADANSVRILKPSTDRHDTVAIRGLDVPLFQSHKGLTPCGAQLALWEMTGARRCLNL